VNLEDVKKGDFNDREVFLTQPDIYYFNPKLPIIHAWLLLNLLKTNNNNRLLKRRKDGSGSQFSQTFSVAETVANIYKMSE
jgi:hypothetical protein